jgi:hypothetical protein
VSLPPELASAARSAPFVFFATVRRPTASAVEALDTEDEPTAVVKVDEVVAAPEVVGDLTEKEVTVRLTGGAVKRGQRLLFLATSLHYGTELAVLELGRLAPRSAEAQLVLQEKLNALDATLVERLRGAELVVYGRVESVEPVATEALAEAEPLGEAPPGWRAATLRVWRTLKGKPPEEPRVVYPFPRTQKWSEVPLFIAGQEGIWILRPVTEEEVAPGRRAPPVPDGFTAFNQLDFHAPGAMTRIRMLLAAAEPIRPRGTR